MNIDKLKEKALEAIDKRREDIISIGDSIFKEPELGYKEFKTAEKVKNVFDSLGLDYQDQLAITGLKATIKGRESKYKIGVIGELDSVISPQHPDSDKLTGAAHACGHNAMIAGLIGLAYAFADTDIKDYLAGDIVLMAVPAEEFIEIAYRRQLIQEGKISFIGGKQEFIKLGLFDDIDIALMQHSFGSGNPEFKGIKAMAESSYNGFIGQEISYYGKEAHAGSNPEDGVNALSAARLAFAAIDAQRETFRDQDNIRVHPIISKGGDLVNTIPAHVKIENYVRANNIQAIFDSLEKVNRSFQAGAYALGAQVQIDSFPGYFPYKGDDRLKEIMYKNLVRLFGQDKVSKDGIHKGGSSDIGDLAALLPTLQAQIGGFEGDVHASNFRIIDKDLIYLGAAKALTLTVIDLLYQDGQLAEEVIKNFKPVYKDKEEYLAEWGSIK